MDLLAIALATVASVSILVWLQPNEAVRLSLSLPLILLFPGYSLVAALLPREQDLKRLERLILSLGLSLAIVPLIGLALHGSPWGVRANPVVAFLSVLVILACALGLWRRYRLPRQERFRIDWQALLTAWRRPRWYDKLLGLALLAATAAGVTVVVILFAGRQGQSEPFSEFYLLGARGRLDQYPTVLSVGDTASARVGIVNREGEAVAYRIEVLVNDSVLQSSKEMAIAEGARWEGVIPFTVEEAAKQQKVEFNLYRRGEKEVYRSLHLWVRAIAPPVAEEAATPAVEVLATAAKPEATPTPEAVVHVVQPGESLAAIAAQYGSTVEAIMKANGIDDANTILPGWELTIPLEAQ